MGSQKLKKKNHLFLETKMTKYRVFPTGEMGGLGTPPPPPTENPLTPPPPSYLEKFSPVDSPPPPNFYSLPTKSQFPPPPTLLMKIFKLQPNKNTTFSCSHCSCTGIKIANGHRTLSGKNCDMSSTHVSKQDILSCTLLLSIICEKSFKLKLV